MADAPAAPSKPGLGSSLKRSPRDLLQSFLERWWMGAISAAIAAPLFFFLQPDPVPEYRTEVTLLFDAKKDRALNLSGFVGATGGDASELTTHIEQIRSSTFFDFVLSSFSQQENDRIQKPYKDPEKPEAPPPVVAAIIRPGMSISPRKNSPILGISITHRDPEVAAMIANKIARRYIDFNLDRAITGTNSAIVFLRNQADELRAQVEAAEAALQAYRTQNNMAALGESQNIVLQRLSAVGTNLLKLKLEIVDMTALLDKADEYRKQGRTLLDIPQIATAVATSVNLVSNLKTERSLLEERYGSKHPRILQNEASLREAERLLTEAIDRSLDDMRSRLEVTQHLAQRMESERAQAEIEARNLDKVSVGYKFLEQEAATKRSSYSRIVENLNQANITSQLDSTNIKVFDPAWVPSTPSNSGTTAIIGKTFAVAFLSFLFLPGALAAIDTRIRSVHQIEEALGENVVGVVKKLHKTSSPECARAFAKNLDTAFTEAFRGIYSELEITSQLEFPKVLLTTSTLAEEGKSQMSCNLASVYASHGRRVLLIDADLRRPTLHRYFNVPNTPGWVKWVETGSTEPLPPGIVSLEENLHFLPAGTAPLKPTEVVARFATREILDRLLRAYDLVIIDSPPAGIFPDAVLLARAAHELVFVCRYKTIRAGQAQKILRRLRDTGVTSLGVILNQMPPSRLLAQGDDAYGAYSHRYYKDYANKEEEKA